MKPSLLSACAGTVLTLAVATAAVAEEATVEMNLINDEGVGASIGTVTLTDSDNGMVIQFALNDQLPPGPHGFHIHENGDCGPADKDGKMTAGLAAGGHFDPDGSGKHEGPSGTGHLGDLPVLQVGIDEDGAREVDHAVAAPRVKVADARGKALVIHASGDNYRDEPKELGGGGARIACGVVPQQ